MNYYALFSVLLSLCASLAVLCKAGIVLVSVCLYVCLSVCLAKTEKLHIT